MMEIQTGLLALFWIGAALVLFTTLAPLTNSVKWWVRGWDFPRIHIAIVALVVTMLGLGLQRSEVIITCVCLVICAGYQALRVYPYTRFAEPEIALNTSIPKSEQVSVIAANVLMENTDHAKLIAMLEDVKPDLLLLMETDQAWVDGLAQHLEKYDTVVSHPLDNHYGLVFASNLDVISAKVVYLADDPTPAILAEVMGPTGLFFFVGLHPRPPVPGNTTIERDEQIERAALIADRKRLPVVAMGDFNDVAWSHSSQQFKKYGEFRDPRIGRAMLPSFDANSWFMRFPIDQLYLTEGLDLVSFDRLAAFGSDHFPMHARFAVNPHATH